MKLQPAVFGLILFVVGCTGSSKSDQGSPVVAGQPDQGLPASAGEPFRLELVKVEPDTLWDQFGGERMPHNSTWNITVKLVRQGSGSPPTVAGDTWLSCVFVTGSPNEAKVEKLMNAHPPRTIPRSGTTSIAYGAPPARTRVYRFGQKDFTSKELEEAFGTGPYDRVGYSLLMAPKPPEEKWDGRSSPEITFPIRNGYDNLADVILKKSKPLEHNAIAVVSLCGFGPEKDGGAEVTLLSKPLRVPLEPGADKK